MKLWHSSLMLRKIVIITVATDTHLNCSTTSPTQQVEAMFHANNCTFNLKIGQIHIKNHTKCSPFLGESHIITVLCWLDNCKVYLVDELNSFMNCE